MKEKGFSGFIGRVGYTPLPNPLFTQLLPEIEDAAELKVTLHLLWRLHQRRGYPCFITKRELLADRTIIAGLRQLSAAPGQALERALEQAVARGTFLRLDLERQGREETLYFTNNEASIRAVKEIKWGEMPLGRPLPSKEPAPTEAKSTIYSLYEQNIGPLTPLIAEQLSEAEMAYPFSWIEGAFKEAVSLNKRNWRYVARILERWASEGKEDGESRRYPKGKDDPDRYIRGKYGHLIER